MMMAMNPIQVNKKEYAELHAKCMAAVRAFCRAAGGTCESLGKCSTESLSDKDRDMLRLALKREQEAFARYSDIRDRLYSRLGVG